MRPDPLGDLGEPRRVAILDLSAVVVVAEQARIGDVDEPMTAQEAREADVGLVKDDLVLERVAWT